MMINEEDHLRLQALQSGFQVMDAWRLLERLDDELDQEVGVRLLVRLGLSVGLSDQHRDRHQGVDAGPPAGAGADRPGRTRCCTGSARWGWRSGVCTARAAR